MLAVSISAAAQEGGNLGLHVLRVGSVKAVGGIQE